MGPKQFNDMIQQVRQDSASTRLSIFEHQKRMQKNLLAKLQDVPNSQLESVCKHAEYSEYWVVHTITKLLLSRLGCY